MYGTWHALKEYFKIERKEVLGVLWTSLAFALILTAFFKGFLRKPIILEESLLFLFIAFLFIFFSLIAHISLQKVVAIKLGYTAQYSYWINGVLFSVFLSFFTLGYVPFILPGSTMITHIPKLRLGKFRYGLNTKDIARVALAGPLSHVVLVMIAGIFFIATGADKSGPLYLFIIVNLFLAIYTCLPIPKIDIPTKMDAASDGLGLFFFSRPIYVLVLFTLIFYAILIIVAQVWSFIIAFVLGIIVSMIYSGYLEQTA